MVTPIFYTDHKDYLFPTVPYGLDKALTLSSIIHLPVEVDTEFEHDDWDTLKGSKFGQKTITTQYRAISLDKGVILSNLPSIARHPISLDEFSLIDYLNLLGYKARLKVFTSRIQTDKKLHIHLIGFFLVAELYRMFRLDAWRDIDRLVYLAGKQRIKMGRRLIAENNYSSAKAEQYIILDNWIIEIDGHSFTPVISFWDTCAMHGKSSYKDFYSISTGTELPYKDNFSPEEKSKMLSMYKERSEDFNNYALGDLYNYTALLANVEQFKTIYETLGVSEYFEPPRMTIGATVARLFRSSLMNHIGIYNPKDLKPYIQFGNSERLKENKSHTSCYLAKVDGGRCRNNRPSDMKVDSLLADIDISGCYGEGLRIQSYPLGRPILIDYPIRSDRNDYITLREFRKKYECELVPGMWFARVSSSEPLTYAQDLLMSWYPPKNLDSIPTDTDLESIDFWTEENIGETKIFLNEVHQAVITHDFLQWLDNVATARQKKELEERLVINAALIYPASKQCTSFDELKERIAEHKGKNKCRIASRGKRIIKHSVEEECHDWYAINLGDLLVTQLLRERKKHPKKTPMNELLKLCINTIYGDEVSPYFDIGNVCVGNNITARARVMAWYMEKGLNGYQSITDGCAFEPNRVPFPRPGLRITSESLVKVKLNANKTNTIISKLDGIEWNKESDSKVLAERALEHLRNLFPNIDILHQFTEDFKGNSRIGQYSLEIKELYEGGVFHGSANYIFRNDSGYIPPKMRSYRKGEHRSVSLIKGEIIKTTEEYDPALSFLKAVDENPYRVPRQKVFIHKSILKTGTYKQNWSDKWEYSEAKPGDTVEVPRLIREFSLNQYTFLSREQYKGWFREYQSLLDKYGQSYEMFFLNKDGSLNYIAMTQRIEKAIREGARNLKSNLKWKEDDLIPHPEFECLKETRRLMWERYGFVLTDAQVQDLISGDCDNN